MNGKRYKYLAPIPPRQVQHPFHPMPYPHIHHRTTMVLRKIPSPNQILPVPNSTTPYWRSELHPIDNHRSTDRLPSTCDIAIIGAGLSGVATAYHIVKEVERAGAALKAPEIVLLEAREVCSGATGRNGVGFTLPFLLSFLVLARVVC
jgi:hypothetical protein